MELNKDTSKLASELSLEEKLEKLTQILLSCGKVSIAFSGGVDSTFLTVFAKEVLGDSVACVTARAATFSSEEMEEADALAKQFSVPHAKSELTWQDISHFAHNPPERCYICKKAVFNRLFALAEDILPGSVLVDGTNLDDTGDYRPGMAALKELGVRSPLKEAGMTKAEIRSCLKARNIPLWNKPAFACLASRIPYGEPITLEKLGAIEAVEKVLAREGFRQFRVRHHGAVARIEVPPEDRLKFMDTGLMDRVDKAAKEAGFSFTALDLAGYKMGSLNGGLNSDH